MPTTLIRTVLLYLIIIGAMKIMGKRQLGQLQLSELVTVTMLSELASYSILETDIPLIYSIAPVVVLISLEVAISFASVKSRTLSRLFDGKPAVLIEKGVLDIKEMENSRITMTELLSEIRASGINSLSEIYYLILEPSGKFSIIPKVCHQPLTPALANVKTEETGIDHAIILDGKIVAAGLSATGRNEDWLQKELAKRKISSPDQVFYFAMSDSGDQVVIKQKKNKK